MGVFPIRTSILAFITSLPHACGGVSYVLCGDGEWRESSPRMWGQFLKPYNLPTPRLPCSRPYPARTAGRAGPANAGFGKALSNHPATGNPPRRSCGKSGAWAAWLQALPVPAFRAGVEASLPAWAARRALLPLRPAPHVGRSAYMRILPFTLAANSSCSAAAALAARMMTGTNSGALRVAASHISTASAFPRR